MNYTLRGVNFAITDSTQQWYEWDVTSFVQSQKAAGINSVTVAVSMAASSVNPDLFNSKEAGANGPQLLVSGSSGEGVTYEWDAANRLVAVNESATLRSEFSYDGLDRRVKAKCCSREMRKSWTTILVVASMSIG